MAFDFEEFKLQYEHTIRDSSTALHDLVDRELFFNRRCKPSNLTLETGLAQSIDRMVTKELAFAQRVITALQDIPGETKLYWDLDETLLRREGEQGNYADIIRPVAPFILDYMKNNGYENWIYTNRDKDAVIGQLGNPNNYNSISSYFTAQNVLSSRNTEDDVDSKADAFLCDISSGILIDNDESVPKLHVSKRGICVWEQNSSYLNSCVGGSIYPERLPELFGKGI